MGWAHRGWAILGTIALLLPIASAVQTAPRGLIELYTDAGLFLGTNLNNGFGPLPMFSITFGYDSTRIMLHELSHNLGAGQDGAPHTPGAGHCWDGRDTMC